MQVFNFDITEARRQFADSGWVHIPQGITEEFFADLERATQQYLQTAKLHQHRIVGKKEQALYTLPEGLDYEAEILRPIAEICQLDAHALTLSERHIQSYDEHAVPEPKPHKDRYGSQVSVGLSIAVPWNSHLVIWPHGDREMNTNDKAIYMDGWPDSVPVVIKDEPRDVVMFQGNSTWHVRRYSAGAVNLYIKVNEFGSDPLGEDPRRAAPAAA